ncbi:MAG: PAS domain-containing protein [Flavobacterium sp.]|nr:PAS domain-containing protein [Flavobacterium sp.]
MGHFKQYDEATAKYHQDLNVKTTPIFSWDFHYGFLSELKNTFIDLNKLNGISSLGRWSQNNWDFKEILKEEVIVVTDTQLRIVFASNNIIKMNGYREEEILGNSPKMFHGEATCQTVSKEIRNAIELQVPFEKTVLNYKKNGETYLCLIKGFPIFDSKGKLSHFIAFEKAA